jgi:hypothetical protein
MRRSKHVLSVVAVGLLVLVGAAAATQQPQIQTSDVSAAFNASQTRMRTRTCYQNGETFRITNAVWRGTSTSSEPRLAGTVVIATHTVVNETTGDGWLSGTWRTRNTTTAPRSNPRSYAHLSAVIDNGDHLDGLASGTVRAPWSRLLGNWSATVAGSAITGELGANAPVAPDNSALLYRGGC